MGCTRPSAGELLLEAVLECSLGELGAVQDTTHLLVKVLRARLDEGFGIGVGVPTESFSVGQDGLIFCYLVGAFGHAHLLRSNPKREREFNVKSNLVQ